MYTMSSSNIDPGSLFLFSGVQTSTATAGCPYCPSRRIDRVTGAPSKPGNNCTWSPVPEGELRSYASGCLDHDRMLAATRDDMSEDEKQKIIAENNNQAHRPVRIGTDDTMPHLLKNKPDPLHFELLGLPNQMFDELDKELPNQMRFLYQRCGVNRRYSGMSGHYQSLEMIS